MGVSQDGQTPLHGAVGRGEVKMIKVLCNHMYGRPPRPPPLDKKTGGVATDGATRSMRRGLQRWGGFRCTPSAHDTRLVRRQRAEIIGGPGGQAEHGQGA